LRGAAAAAIAAPASTRHGTTTYAGAVSVALAVMVVTGVVTAPLALAAALTAPLVLAATVPSHAAEAT
jgi:hypothetical protein